jgi:hypothetical protein
MKNEATRTSRQMRLCRSISAQNQRKPNFEATGAPSSFAGAFADSWRTRSTSVPNVSFIEPTGAVCGAWLPATK